MFKQNRIQSSVRAGALAVATAMTGMGLVGLSTSAQAVSVAADGLGEAMIFPYYTTRNNFASYFNVTNTSNKVVFIKVRWNEGENSRDARDFNVVLSPYDMWAVATVKSRIKFGGDGFVSVGDENGDGQHDFNAMAMTQDNSCTIPVLPERLDDKGQPKPDGRGQKVGIVPFTNLAYTGDDFDSGNTTHDRTREGYFTIFEMGVIDIAKVEAGTGIYADASKQALARKIIKSATHSKVGDNTAVPGGDEPVADKLGCDYINTFYKDSTELAKLKKVVTEPENVLKGRAVLINLATGVAQGYDPITLEDYFSPDYPADGTSKLNLMSLPSKKEPNLLSTSPAVAVLPGGPVDPVFGKDTSGADAVSQLLARTNVINDYNLTAGSQTDWVLTFPTKKFYVDADLDSKGGDNYAIKRDDLDNPGADTYPYAGAKPNPPFGDADIFYDEDKNEADAKYGDRVGSAGESCLKISYKIRDREEYEGDTPPGTVAFSPMPKTPKAEGAYLCKEANILSFGNSNIYDSKLRSALFEGNIAGLPGLNGWANISFPSAATNTFGGIPVVGMRLEARANGVNPQSKYGFSSNHAYKR